MSTIENIVKSLAYATEHNQGLHLTHEEVPALLNHLEGLESDLQGYEKWTDNHYQVQIKEGFIHAIKIMLLLGEQLRTVCDYCGASSSWCQVEGYQDTEAAVQLWNMRPNHKIKHLRRYKK